MSVAATAVRKRPEILAPAGSPECLPAAVAGGADAVFLGLRHFNARGRAENFRKADLARHVRYLHQHGLKCYVVMNILVHDDEFPKAIDLATAARDAQVDALIIQDLGLWRTLARELPGLPRHASTQMTLHHPSQIEVLAGLGAQRVILARELNLQEIERCTRAAASMGVETEHFVHGALCYAFSGQCLMSNFAGCRSANRGTCAQNCRFDYVTNDSGAPMPAQPDTHISMKDLALVGRMRELCDSGVASFKIEGRLKGPEYVYTTSRIYRLAVDAWHQGIRFDLAGARQQLKDVFARPWSEAWLQDDYSTGGRLHRYDPQLDLKPDAHLVSSDRQLGSVVMDSEQAITAGQGYSFSVGFFNGGFLVTAADRLDGRQWRCKVRIAEHGPRLPRMLPVFRNADHQRKREAAIAMAAVPLLSESSMTIAIDLRVSGDGDGPLCVEAATHDGRSARQQSAQPLRTALSAAIDAAMLRDKLGAFGGTGFHLGELHNAVAAGLFIPAAELKAMRRRLVDALLTQPISAPQPSSASVAAAADEAELAEVTGVSAQPRLRSTRLWVAVGGMDQARAARAAGADAVWLDDPTLDLWGPLPPTIASGDFPPGSLYLRHPATAPLSSHLQAIGLPVVAGHLGVLAAASRCGLPAVADAACNIFSSHTLLALAELGAHAGVISLECSGREIARLAGRMAGHAAPALAVVVHGRLAAMLTRQEHDLAFGQIATLQATADDGGLPYQLERRRPNGTVVWEGRRLCAPHQAQATAGLVDAWVLELSDLPGEAVAELVRAYARLRDQDISPEQITDLALHHAPFGLFSGHLERGSRELDVAHDRLAQQALPE